MDPGVTCKSRMCPPYTTRVVKGRLNGSVSRNNRLKRLAPCRFLDGHVDEPYEMSTNGVLIEVCDVKK